MKGSKVRAKRRNQACREAGVVRVRRFKMTPTFGNGDRIPVGNCTKVVGETKLSRTRWLKGKRRTVNVMCGGTIVATRGRHKRRVFCVDCQDRRRLRAAEARQARTGKPWLRREQHAQQSKLARLVPRFNRRTN